MRWDNLGIILPPVSTELRGSASNVSHAKGSFFVKLFFVNMLSDDPEKVRDLPFVEAALLLRVVIAQGA